MAGWSPDPMPPPLISLDVDSPTLALLDLTAADILSAPPPEAFVPYFILGLMDADELNAFSWGPGPRDGETYALLFSVERGLFAGEPPDANLASLGYIYNAFQQAELNQAASDMFMSTSLFDNNGQVGVLLAAPNNVLVIDGGNAGGTDFNLIPGDPITVDDPNPGDQDNINGFGNPPGGRLASARGADIVYFTLQRDSPSLPDLPGTASGADIYYIDLGDPPGPPQLFASAPSLGLLPWDNISAMTVLRASDDAVGPWSPGDRVVFALDAESPSLMELDSTASDLHIASFGQPIVLYASGHQFGLSPDARLSALTYYLTGSIFQAILHHGIKTGPVVGDLDGDGQVNHADLAILLAAWNSVPGDPNWNPNADINGDGEVNLADLAFLLSNYGFGT